MEHGKERTQRHAGRHVRREDAGASSGIIRHLREFYGELAPWERDALPWLGLVAVLSLVGTSVTL